MLDLDFMLEQEIIEILHNETYLSEIIKGNIVGFYMGEEQPIKLWHLFERISPVNQDTVLNININSISKLIFKTAQESLNNSLKNSPEQNKQIYLKIYQPLINLINKMSIKIAKELVSTTHIQKLLINEKINSDIIYTALASISKPSVLKELLKYVNLEIEKTKMIELDIKNIKIAINNAIKQNKEFDTVKQHFTEDYQRIVDKEKNNLNKRKTYLSIKGIITNILSNIINHREEQREQRYNQQNINQVNTYIEDLRNQTANSKPRR